MFTSQLILCVLVAAAMAQSVPGSRSVDASRDSIQALIVGGKRDTNVPWHAAIFRPTNTSYQLICGGTLVTARMVITAAHCFWNNQRNKKIDNEREYRVGLGQIISFLKLNEGSQSLSIAKVTLHPDFRDRDLKFQHDIAVVELSSEATLNTHVNVALVDWDNKYTDKHEVNNRLGLVAGFGITEGGTSSFHLMSIQLPYVDQTTCYDSLSDVLRVFVTNDKFCAGYINQNRSVCSGDSGGGLMFFESSTQKFYLRGIVSIAFRPPGRDDCYIEHYSGFTRVNDPKNLRMISGIVLPVATQVRCPPILSSASVQVRICTTDGVPVSCARPMRVGTRVEMRCHDGFTSTGNSTWTTMCQENGEWTKQHQTCRAEDCGSRDVRQLSVDGEAVKSDQPWLISIYLRSSSTSRDWVWKSTGTLITATHIVTDAISFSYADGSAVPAARYRLMAGKHLSVYTITEPNTQTRDVKAVIRHDQFNYTNAVNNIALLVADRPFVLTWNVNIVCVDWNTHAPTSGQHVITAGVRRGTNTASLVYEVQPQAMVSYTDCLSEAKENRRRYLATDNICYRTTSNVTCNSVPGAGLLVERPTARGASYYLVGVVRNELAWTQTGRCLSNMLASYTSISLHASWLRPHIDKT